MYPIMLDIQDCDCLVVGGGGVALRKVEGLLREGARVTVVAPQMDGALKRLEKEKRIRWIRRAYRKEDVKGRRLVFVATNRRELNERVSKEAAEQGIWTNVADVPDLCDFHLPGRIRRGRLQLMIASGGEAPFLVSRLRRQLERMFGAEWGEWIEAAGRFRRRVRNRIQDPAERERCFDRFFDETLDERRWMIRIPSRVEEERWIREGEKTRRGSMEGAELANFRRSERSGLVSLVGAGPGDPGLLTRRGYERLLKAEAVVYDHLAETALPPGIDDQVELHPVGKKAGYHPVPQPEINRLLIRLARQGKRVVRLKGGDPLIFGRGGEEMEALEEANVDYEVVPGITSAVGVAAYAGIPVTQRNEVVHLSLVTAHESEKAAGPQVRWDLLARDPHTTLAGYMGVTSLPRVVDSLLEAGLDPDTPSIMIREGTTSQQRSVCAPVSELPRRVAQSGMRPPGLFLIGPMVERARTTSWFERRPLFGQRWLALNCSPDRCEALEIAGAEVVRLPIPLSSAARVVVQALPVTGCLFSDADEVQVMEEIRSELPAGSKMTAWCFQEEAARKAREAGWQEVFDIPETLDSEQMVKAMAFHSMPRLKQVGG